ncbi:hypothetical protein [Pseudonocardia xishanensis]|uniref:Uncharacterized protein n=1 Tax=Pseudonocardia xishanensis TaxID=630995 RepID=A0ABP8S2R1_9PSEU
MVAVPGMEGIGRPVDPPVAPVRGSVAGGRVVAVAVSPMELLRPESDLARIVAGAGRVDLLIARDDAPQVDDIPRPAVSPESVWTAPESRPVDLDGDLDDDLDGEFGEYDDGDDGDGLAEAVAALALPDLHVHRLGLPGRVGADAADVLVAALSELVGFDPEPGVYFVAPQPAPSDPERAAVLAAARRIGRVYGLPMLRYRTLELSVVGD